MALDIIIIYSSFYGFFVPYWHLTQNFNTVPNNLFQCHSCDICVYNLLCYTILMAYICASHNGTLWLKETKQDTHINYTKLIIALTLLITSCYIATARAYPEHYSITSSKLVYLFSDSFKSWRAICFWYKWGLVSITNLML